MTESKPGKPIDVEGIAKRAAEARKAVGPIGAASPAGRLIRRLVGDVTALLAERERLRRYLMQEPVGGPLRKEGDGSVVQTLEHPMTRMFMAAMANLLDAYDGQTNYVAVSGYHERLGKLEAIIQRVGRLTPHTARAKAETELRRAVALLAEHGIPWDGAALTFAPTETWKLETSHKDGDWITIDFGDVPNVLHCGRCHARQEMPTKATADVYQAVGSTFAKRHKRCKVGDDQKPTLAMQEAP